MLLHVYEFVCFYFISMIYEYTVYLMICSGFELKISRKKALVSAFFYANFLTITNSLSNIIIAQKMIDETLPIIILTKIISITGEILIILFLSRSLKRVWYQVYWLTIVLHIILIIPMIYYMKFFTSVDSKERTIYHAVDLSNLLQYLISIAIMLLSYVAIWHLLKFVLKKVDLNKVSLRIWVVIYSIWASSVLMTVKTYQYSADDTSDRIIGFDNYREVTIALLVIIFCVAVAIIHSDRRVLKIENNLLKEQNEIQFANYIAMQQKDMEIHKLYHDIGNHISTIQILVDQGETQEAKEYTRRLNEQYNGLKKGLYCNNKIINAVLLQKLKVCEESGIRYELELSIPQSLPFQDIDLMCIYSNLLDNAIEGCQRNSVTDNYIKIKTAQIGNYLGIKIINSKSAEHSMPDGDSAFGTSKKDKSVHGYGLRIIEEIVKHYDGYKELQEERKEFSAMVMLKLTSAVEN